MNGLRTTWTTVGIILICTGCSNIPVHENAFHALNIIDTGQTINVARRPDCFREVGTLRYVTGSTPSQSEVYLTLAAVSLAYHYTNRWLDKKIESKESGTQAQGNWIITRAVFNGVAIVGKFVTVMNNADIGSEPWGGGCYE